VSSADDVQETQASNMPPPSETLTQLGSPGRPQASLQKSQEDPLIIELGPVEARQRQVDVPEARQVVTLGRPGNPLWLRLWWRAMLRIVAQVAEHPDLEVAGLLVGTVRTEANRVVTLVWDVAHATQLPATPIEVTMTHEAWQEAIEQVWSRDDGGEVVGWYHSHPGFGVFMSTADRFIASHFFAQPGYVSLVYDNKRREVGAYCWYGGQLRDMNGLELALGREASNTAWQRLRYARRRSLLANVAVWLQMACGGWSKLRR
jgi:proteasome lid subunit RPN8/RPN11